MAKVRMTADAHEEAAVPFEYGMVNRTELGDRYGVHIEGMSNAMKKMGARYNSMASKPDDPTAYGRRKAARIAIHVKTSAQVAAE